MSNTNEFSWENNESVVFSTVDGIAVYTNQKGDIVIRQEDSVNLRGEDPLVTIPKNHATKVIAAIQRELNRE